MDIFAGAGGLLVAQFLIGRDAGGLGLVAALRQAPASLKHHHTHAVGGNMETQTVAMGAHRPIGHHVGHCYGACQADIGKAQGGQGGLVGGVIDGYGTPAAVQAFHVLDQHMAARTERHGTCLLVRRPL